MSSAPPLGRTSEQAAVELVPLRWWHLSRVMELERALFGSEQWSEESYWSELAACTSVRLADSPAVSASGSAAVSVSGSPQVSPSRSRFPFSGSPHHYWAALTELGLAGEALLGYGGVAVTDDEAYIQTLGVARSAQRAGIGRRILQRLLDDGSADGARTCWLEVRADNLPAQAMYAAYGFRPRGRRRGYYQPSGTDAIVMSVDLSAPTTHSGGERP
jgi:[ribosomal protein S18]-alanine N-acetyltransferase